MAEHQQGSKKKILTLEECRDYTLHLFNTLPVIMRIEPPDGEPGTEEEWSRKFAAITPGNVFVHTSVPTGPVRHQPKDHPGSCVGVGSALPLLPAAAVESEEDALPAKVSLAEVNTFFKKLTMKKVARSISTNLGRQPGDLSFAMASLPTIKPNSVDLSEASASSSSCYSPHHPTFHAMSGRTVDYECMECGSNPVKRACAVLANVKKEEDKLKKSQGKRHAREKLSRQCRNFFLYYVQCGHAFCKKCVADIDLEALERCKVSGCQAKLECVVPSKIIMDKCTAQLYIRVVISEVLKAPDSEVFKCPLFINCTLKDYCIFQHPWRRQQGQASGTAALPSSSTNPSGRPPPPGSYQSTKVLDSGLFSVHLLEFVDRCPQPQPLVLQHVPATFSDSGVRITDRITNSITADSNMERIFQFLKYYVRNPVEVGITSDLVGITGKAAPRLLQFGFIMDSQRITPPSVDDYFKYLQEVQARLQPSHMTFGLTQDILEWLFATRCLHVQS